MNDTKHQSQAPLWDGWKDDVDEYMKVYDGDSSISPNSPVVTSHFSQPSPSAGSGSDPSSVGNNPGPESWYNEPLIPTSTGGATDLYMPIVSKIDNDRSHPHPPSKDDISHNFDIDMTSGNHRSDPSSIQPSPYAVGDPRRPNTVTRQDPRKELRRPAVLHTPSSGIRKSSNREQRHPLPSSRPRPSNISTLQAWQREALGRMLPPPVPSRPSRLNDNAHVVRRRPMTGHAASIKSGNTVPYSTYPTSQNPSHPPVSRVSSVVHFGENVSSQGSGPGLVLSVQPSIRWNHDTSQLHFTAFHAALVRENDKDASLILSDRAAYTVQNLLLGSIQDQLLRDGLIERKGDGRLSYSQAFLDKPLKDKLDKAESSLLGSCGRLAEGYRNAYRKEQLPTLSQLYITDIVLPQLPQTDTSR